jgi:hypothetical protein
LGWVELGQLAGDAEQLTVGPQRRAAKNSIAAWPRSR